MTQAELNFADKATRKRVAPKLARKMIAYLIASPGWTTREEFHASLGLTDREVRLGREASHSRIAYGQKGLKLLNQLTLEEWQEYDNRLAADIRAAQERRRQSQIRYHNFREKLNGA
jgi:hypothetical protein